MMSNFLGMGCVYNIPRGRITQLLCKTNTRNNNSFRSVAVPSGQLMMENCIQTVAEALGLPTEQVTIFFALNFIRQ